MSSYYTPRNVVIGRHWKRPKPRVYECNVRDAERFYQETYKDYLQSKDFAARRASEDRTRVVDDEPASRWSLRRTNSLVDSPGDSFVRDNLRNGSTSSSYFDSAATGPSRSRGEDSYSSSSLRSSSVVNQRRESPDGEIATIEQRLQRLRKLREDLGLPSETGGGISFSSTSNASSSRASARQSPPLETSRRSRVAESTTSYSSTRGGSTSRDPDTYGVSERGSKYTSKYSADDDSASSSRYSSKYGNGDDASSRTSKYASKYKDDEDSYSRTSDVGSRTNGRSVTFSSSTGAKDDSDSYSSYKSSAKSASRKYDADDDSSYGSSGKSSYKSSAESKTYKSSGKGLASSSAADDDMGNYDDDELLSSIKKKFPTSDEILQRIKKLDDDL